MDWKYKPARGTSRGILVGLRSSCFAFEKW
jgi:hypothetical protein